MKIKSIDNFVLQNPHISVNVFGYDEEKDTVYGPLYSNGMEKENHVNMLFLDGPTPDNYGHYMWIKNMSGLLSSQLGKNGDKRWFCNKCLSYSTNEARAQRHAERCTNIVSEAPKEGDVIKFDHINRQLEVPFAVYADFECILEPTTIDVSEKTQIVNKHIPIAFGYYIKCSFDPALDKYVSKTGSNVGRTFVDSLTSDLSAIYESFWREYDPEEIFWITSSLRCENLSGRNTFLVSSSTIILVPYLPVTRLAE
nr:uncharacterized protein LOC121503284 [Drosophila kikkawai]